MATQWCYHGDVVTWASSQALGAEITAKWTRKKELADFFLFCEVFSSICKDHYVDYSFFYWDYITRPVIRSNLTTGLERTQYSMEMFVWKKLTGGDTLPEGRGCMTTNCNRSIYYINLIVRCGDVIVMVHRPGTTHHAPRTTTEPRRRSEKNCYKVCNFCFEFCLWY